MSQTSSLSDDANKLASVLQRLPLALQEQQNVEELVQKCTPEELQSLGLGAPARPCVPRGLSKLAPAVRLQAVQRVISSLQYNHLPGYLYNVSKDRPYCHIMNTAKEVLKDGLPIKCIEAVFLGLLLTSDWSELDRLPVGFKSKCEGQTYRHIVLAVRHVPTNTWGALGISRRKELQYKELKATTLDSLMLDYKESYETWGHELVKIRVGLPMEHDNNYTGQACWRYCNVSCGRHPWPKCAAVLQAFADSARMLANRYKVLGFRPPSRGGGYADAPGCRVALSGTTPEPGAARPPPVAAATRPQRHSKSVSPTRKKQLAGSNKSILDRNLSKSSNNLKNSAKPATLDLIADSASLYRGRDTGTSEREHVCTAQIIKACNTSDGNTHRKDSPEISGSASGDYMASLHTSGMGSGAPEFAEGACVSWVHHTGHQASHVELAGISGRPTQDTVSLHDATLDVDQMLELNSDNSDSESEENDPHVM